MLNKGYKPFCHIIRRKQHSYRQFYEQAKIEVAAEVIAYLCFIQPGLKPAAQFIVEDRLLAEKIAAERCEENCKDVGNFRTYVQQVNDGPQGGNRQNERDGENYRIDGELEKLVFFQKVITPEAHKDTKKKYSGTISGHAGNRVEKAEELVGAKENQIIDQRADAQGPCNT